MRRIGIGGFRFRGHGLDRVLGSLELEVMNVFWTRARSARLSIREVTDEIGRRRDVSFNTVMTVMNRLVEKLVLRKQGARVRSYRYVARLDREEFVEHVTRQLVEGLVKDFGDLAVPQFVRALESIDPLRLEELEAALERRRAREDR